MKKCEYVDWINSFLDKELSKEKEQILRNHLLECHYCQTELQELQKINKLLKSYNDEENDEEVPDYLINNTLNQTIRKERIDFKKVVNFPIAALVIFTFISGIILSNITFNSNKVSLVEFGQDSFYSYFEGGEDV